MWPAVLINNFTQGLRIQSRMSHIWNKTWEEHKHIGKKTKAVLSSNLWHFQAHYPWKLPLYYQIKSLPMLLQTYIQTLQSSNNSKNRLSILGNIWSPILNKTLKKWAFKFLFLFCFVLFLFVFFFFFSFKITFTLFYFTILYWFCHTLTWIHHGCTCDPKHEPPSYLPPHNIPLGHPHAPAPSMLYPKFSVYISDWLDTCKYMFFSSIIF